MAWTQEREDLCVKMWVEGDSATEIANALGGVTRNGVIGKIHRLGLGRPAKTQRSSTKRLERSARGVRRPPSRPCADRLAEGPGEDSHPTPPPPPAPEVLVSLDALKSDMCRFPYGDSAKDGFGFCGRPTPEGKSYCPEHHRLCLIPAARVRRRRRNSFVLNLPLTSGVRA